MSAVAVSAVVGPALELRDLHKRYGKSTALDGLSFTVPRGSVCGLVGENGAGKTTCLSIIGGFLRADSGTVDILGEGPFNVRKHRGRVGILPQDAELPEESTLSGLMTGWARLQGLAGEAANRAAADAIAAVQLSDRAQGTVKSLSHGMRRRLSVASALLGAPELVLLDEPTAGLDPAQARHLRQVLAEKRGSATVLISSHNLPELESLCDHVIVVNKGRCVRNEPMRLVTGKDREVSIHLAHPLPEGRQAIVKLRLAPDDPTDLAEATTRLVAELIAEGAKIAEIRRGSALEDRYFAE